MTKIKPLEKFFAAEGYHQDYLAKSANGYCPDHSTGVKFSEPNLQNTSSNPLKANRNVNNEALLIGKHILILDSENYCPYCEKFKKEVVNDYSGTLSLHFRFSHQLQGLTLKTPTWATPTVAGTQPPI